MTNAQNEPAVLGPVERHVRPRTLPFAVFDEFGNGADDRVQDYAATAVAAECERCAKVCDAEASTWRGSRSHLDFILCAARIRSGA